LRQFVLLRQLCPLYRFDPFDLCDRLRLWYLFGPWFLFGQFGLSGQFVQLYLLCRWSQLCP